MFTLTALSNYTDGLTLALSGNVSADALPEIGRKIDDGRLVRKHVVLDLGEVTLLDREAARFFADQATRGVELANCPIYIKRWILRETAS